MSKCPHCGGALTPDHDGYEHYYTCIMCGRSFGSNGKSTQMTPVEFTALYGIRLAKKEE